MFAIDSYEGVYSWIISSRKLFMNVYYMCMQEGDCNFKDVLKQRKEKGEKTRKKHAQHN